MRPQLKSALDFAPLLVFFAAYLIAGKVSSHNGLMWATGAFMIATLASLAISYAMERKLHILPLVTGAIVLIFGGLTLLLNDERFIKMKPTIIYVLFASALLGGLALKRLFIKHVFGTVFELTEAGWRALTLRWGLFFLALAVLNEIVRRVLSTDAWVMFKVWGFMGIILIFSLWQVLTLAHGQAKRDKAGE
jgi:intracellular septation protein